MAVSYRGYAMCALVPGRWGKLAATALELLDHWFESLVRILGVVRCCVSIVSTQMRIRGEAPLRALKGSRGEPPVEPPVPEPAPVPVPTSAGAYS
jgi:hypothetical protein